MIFAHCEVSRRSRLRITFWYISGNTVVYKYCLDTDTVVLFCSSLFVLLLLVLITWSVPQPTLLVSTWVLSLHTHGLHGLFTWFTWFTWLPFSTSSIRQNQIKWLKSPLDGVFKGFLGFNLLFLKKVNKQLIFIIWNVNNKLSLLKCKH